MRGSGAGVSLLPHARTPRWAHRAWRGPTELVLDEEGWAGAAPFTGWYFRQTRLLRDLRLEVAGAAPHACSLAEVAPDELEAVFLYPEVERGGGGGSGSGGSGTKGGVLHRDIDIRLRYLLQPASLELTLLLTSRWQDVSELELSWLLSADFAAVDEALFEYRDQQAPVHVTAVPGGVRFCYAHAAMPLETTVLGEGAEWSWQDGRLMARVPLPRQRTCELKLTIRAHDPEDPIDAEAEHLRQRRLQEWSHALPALHAPAESPLVEITNTALRDLGSLALLEGPPDEWLNPCAGIPLYVSYWARDALTASWQAGLFDRGEMLGDVLTYLARLQGQKNDPALDEEPGRIINQAKTDPLARLGITPFGRYYADVASPFMFLIGFGYHYAVTGDAAFVAKHWDAALRVLDWAQRYGDRDDDGYVEYLTRAPKGPRHQAWKDSDNAIVDGDGRQIDPPIASCEIQGYWYASLQFMAVLAAVVMHDRSRARALWRESVALKERFNRDFWLESEGCLASGLDAEKRPLTSLTSNAGQCLPTGIVAKRHIPRLARRLFEPDLFSGWGIRTLSTGNPAYNPLDYHLGTVWPVENGSILFGLRRYGLEDRMLELARGLYDLARLWPQGRVPECVGGYSRDEAAHPGVYPRANAPQTWNQSVWPLLLQSLLGLVPCAPLHLLLVDPVLPPWLPELLVKRLRVGNARVTLRFRRDSDGATHWKVVEREGQLRVLQQPWVESFSADAWERLAGLAKSVKSLR